MRTATTSPCTQDDDRARRQRLERQGLVRSNCELLLAVQQASETDKTREISKGFNDSHSAGRPAVSHRPFDGQFLCVASHCDKDVLGPQPLARPIGALDLNGVGVNQEGSALCFGIAIVGEGALSSAFSSALSTAFA